MKFLVIVSALFVAGMLGLRTALSSGKLLQYLDTHPHPTRVPKAEYYIGDVYYIIGNLQQSATYFLRVAENYPKSDLADDAYFSYIQSLDDMNTPRSVMAPLYASYLEKFPEGKHLFAAQKRWELYRNIH